MPMENEDIHHSPSEPEVEEIHHSPRACVADEHDYQKTNDSKSSRGDDDDDIYDGIQFLNEFDFTGINDDVPTNIEFDLNDEDFNLFSISPAAVQIKAKEEENTKQIKDLQTSLGSVLTSYLNLKNVLYDAFSEKVKALLQQPHGVDDPPLPQSPHATNDLHVDPPAPRTTTIVERFEKEPEGSRARITIKQGKRVVIANQREGLLFMKNTNEDRNAKEPALTVTV
ncbi:unnamed protein product [Lactuca saligna]|uniref:Uncharacterized protein n=1 Tax=Lactuca saligna TaxID=75948 RepID=A0AA35YXS2_LACSI|nr:unnamed protein product [Lactuca saligna]